MEKKTKNKITRGAVGEHLYITQRGTVVLDAFIVLIMLLLFTPLFFLGLFLARFLPLLGGLFAAFCPIPPAFCTYNLCKEIRIARCLKRGEFSVVKDTVAYRAKGEMPRYGEGRGSVNVIYFVEHDRYVVSSSTFDMCGEG
ncbi:MAG: hypothetical protein J6R04_02840, partial [Clostridia bacterium]|nr:hypothetical protein [Clostridia bacterium]